MEQIKRDPIGLREVYYYYREGEIVSSPGLRELLDKYRIPVVIDSESLEMFLSLGFVPAPKTMIKDVFKLPPGCVLGDIECTQQFKKPLKLQKTTQSVEQITREVRKLLTEIVERPLNDLDLPTEIGVILSEGIDSLALLWLLKHVYRRQCSAFYCTFEEELSGNEINKSILNELECKAEGILITADNALKWLFDIVRDMEDCLADPELIASYGMNRYIVGKCNTIFSSQGADHLFGGIMFYLTMRNSEKHYKEGQVALCSEKRAMRFISYLHDLTFVEKKTLTNIINKNTFQDSLVAYLEDNEDIVDLLIHWMLVTYIPEGLIRRNVMSLKHSDARIIFPFLDEKMVNFSYSIPSEYKVYGNINKFLLHEAFSDVVSTQSLKRYQPDFHTPLRVWTKNPLWLDFMHSVFTESDYFDYQLIKDRLEKNKRGEIDNSKILFQLLIFELWLKDIRTRCSTINIYTV